MLLQLFLRLLNLKTLKRDNFYCARNRVKLKKICSKSPSDDQAKSFLEPG